MFSKQYGFPKVHTSIEAITLPFKVTAAAFAVTQLAVVTARVTGMILILAEAENHKPYGGFTEDYQTIAIT